MWDKSLCENAFLYTKPYFTCFGMFLANTYVTDARTELYAEPDVNPANGI